MTVPQIEKAVIREREADWCEVELGSLELTDGRLRERAIDSLKRLSQQPQASIPQACGEWSATKATYGLFKHEKVSHEGILKPHREQTIERMKGYERILAVQDSSYLDLTHFEKMGELGPIGTEKQGLRGLVMHSTIAVTEQGLNLGVLNQAVWARAEAVENGAAEGLKTRPIEEKESHKWLVALRATPKLPDVEVVTICDAEADVYELLALAVALEKEILVRAAQDRVLMPPETQCVFKSVAAVPLCAQLTLNLSATATSPARQAKVSVHLKKVKLKPPARPKEAQPSNQDLPHPLPPLTLYAVLVREVAPPDGVKPVVWLLLTTVPVASAEDALQRVEWYCQRWQIEVWHKILKSGCRIEHRHLKAADRLLPCLALYDMIAWHLHWLTHFARHDPNAPASVALTQTQWQALWIHATGSTQPPPQPPSMAQAILWIAQLGGFLARKHDGFPGVSVLWRGWQRLQDLTAMYSLFLPHPAMGKT